MATHSVPQDVEADDKLIGFLSLKQFIFVIIGLGFGYLTFFFFTKVHPLSAVIWLPFSLIFLVLGLYQRKDQPAEVFLLSALGFYLKPKVRIWSQDGYEERVHITAPPVIEKKYTKDFSGEEAIGRLEGLSLVMDSRGWATKKTADWQNPQLATIAANSDRIIDMQDMASSQPIDPQQFSQPADPYDDRSMVGQQFEAKIEAADNSTHQQALRVLQTAQQPADTLGSTTLTSPPLPSVSAAQPPVVNSSTNQASQSLAQEPIQALPSITDQVSPATVPIQDDQIDDSVRKGNPSATKPAPKKPTVPKQVAEQLNVPHQNEDGSVELRLH